MDLQYRGDTDNSWTCSTEETCKQYVVGLSSSFFIGKRCPGCFIGFPWLRSLTAHTHHPDNLKIDQTAFAKQIYCILENVCNCNILSVNFLHQLILLLEVPPKLWIKIYFAVVNGHPHGCLNFFWWLKFSRYIYIYIVQRKNGTLQERNGLAIPTFPLLQTSSWDNLFEKKLTSVSQWSW